MRLVRKSGEGTLEVIELRPGSNRLGRARNNDFTIEDPTISAAHCTVIWQDGAVLVQDGGSTNGTFIDQQPIKESLLKPGQTLQLGAVQLLLEAAPPIVAIPQVDFREPAPPSILADGSQACLNHPEVRARRKCTQCQKTFCEPCVHTLRRIGGKVLKLCPSCSGPCEIIAGRDDGKPKRKSRLA